MITDPFDWRYQNVRFVGGTNALEFWSAFAIVTPCNPRGKTQSDATNQKLIARFQSRLNRSGLEYVWLVGTSTDGLHQEISFALALSDYEARKWASSFEQIAFYMVMDGAVYLHETEGVRSQFCAQWSDVFSLDARLDCDEIPSRIVLR